jgi:hypothetical protein
MRFAARVERSDIVVAKQERPKDVVELRQSAPQQLEQHGEVLDFLVAVMQQNGAQRGVAGG